MSGLSAYLCRVETVVWSSEVARCWPGEVRLAGGDGAELVEMLGFVQGIFLAVSIADRWSGSRSFLLAAARLRGLHLDSLRRGAARGAARRKPWCWLRPAGQEGQPGRLGGLEQLAELLDGFAVAESFAGSVVEFGGHPVEVGRGVDGQVAALREVLAEQPVGRSYVCQAALASSSAAAVACMRR